MKRPLVTIFSLLAALAPNLCAQTTSTPTPVPTWAQSYGFGTYDRNGAPFVDNQYGSGQDTTTAIAPMPDGGVVVAGQLSPYELQNKKSGDSGEAAAGLVRYDRLGAIVWQQLLRQDNDTTSSYGEFRPGLSHISQLRTDAAGNVFVCGQTGSSGNVGGSPFVAKFSPAGALLWQNGLNGIVERDIIRDVPTDYTYGVTEYTSMALTSDGGVVVGSAVYSQGNGHTDPIIVKFNSDGAVAFHRVYAGLSQYSGVISISERQGGNGYAVLLPGSGATVMVTDGNGNPVLQRSFNTDRTGGDASFITQSADGGYFLIGGVTAGAEVRKLRADLTAIWQKTITRYVSGNGMSVYNNVTPTSDGGCIMHSAFAEGFYKAYGNGAGSAVLFQLDGNGVLTGAHLLGGTVGEGYSLSSAVTTDGALAFTCGTLSYGTGPGTRTDWWVVKATMSGKVAGFSGTMTDAPLDAFAQADSSETASIVTNNYGPGLPNEVGSTTTSTPHIVQEDLGNNIGINKPTVKTQTTTPIPPPVHGGLSGITFSVNESTDPVLGLADTVLRFRSVQSGRAAGLNVRVQSSTDNGATWTDLSDGASGRMSFVSRLGAYVLNSTGYPATNSVYFRSTAKAGGYGRRAQRQWARSI